MSTASNLVSALSSCTFAFVPVRIARGRKFKGFAYDLRIETCTSVAYNVDVYSTKLWDPVNCRYAYANPEFCIEDDSVAAADIAIAKLAYIKHTITSTIEWCKQQKPDNECEALAFARNILRKRHPEMMPAINVMLPDNRDVAAEVERTLQWASNLKTRECWLYGKHCPGGKPLAPERKVSIALKSLTRRGVTALDGFNEVWQLTLTTMGLPLITTDKPDDDEAA